MENKFKIFALSNIWKWKIKTKNYNSKKKLSEP
jgi:hypothetical protein